MLNITRTVGFDFGTHQTKLCVENKVGAELNYEFFKFCDANGKEQYTLPSIIREDANGHLTYGYLPVKAVGRMAKIVNEMKSFFGSSTKQQQGEIIRNFKQAVFTNVNNGMDRMDAVNYSIWYIANILFDLEEKYGRDFAIQMGVPSDGEHLNQQKQLAVRILLSAYRLVEEEFENDKERFLSSTVADLKSRTEFVVYSKDLKEDLSILVFPEAYACLMPLIKSAKIATGMSLMVDIGGGTTDISFFTIKNGKPQVYDFYSIDKGLNYLADAESMSGDRTDSNVRSASEIKEDRKTVLEKDVLGVCNKLKIRLYDEFNKKTGLSKQKLTDALKSRPLIYTGGGSTFQILRMAYSDFEDIIQISDSEWRSESIREMDNFKTLGLCPILSTAYGLSINVPDDNICCESFEDIFSGLRNKTEEDEIEYAHEKFSFADDRDAW